MLEWIPLWYVQYFYSYLVFLLFERYIYIFNLKCIVDDEIVIDLVKRDIQEAEKEKKSWILEGFPRTKNQALSLQKLGILPNKVILLKQSKEASLERIKLKL